jgi:outer membrane protein W
MGKLERFLVGACAAGALLCSAEPARADTKWELGFRTGYGIALGKVDDETDGELNKTIKGQVPLWFDLGARFSDHHYLGLYFSYGFGIKGDFVKSLCATTEAQVPGVDVSCSTHDMRLGIQYLYHLKPPGELDPYFGVGVGFEWMAMDVTASAGGVSSSATVTAHGLEFVNLQLGLDVPVAGKFALGPFAAFALGQYSGASLGNDSGSTSGDFASKALHEWIFLGLRGTFVL